LSDEEKTQLLKIAESTLSSELEDEIQSINDEAEAIKQQISVAQSKLGKDLNGTT